MATSDRCYNAGSINGVQLIQGINGSDIESISVINSAWVEHMPLQTVVYYHGTISGAASKTTEVSFMPGWYVCNGYSTVDGTPPDYINTPRFLRGMSSISDAGGGYNNKIVYSHSHSSAINGAHYGHTASSTSDPHSHTISPSLVRYSGASPPFNTGHSTGAFMRTFAAGEFIFLGGSSGHSHTVSSSGNHSNHSIGNSGSSGVNNMPVYKTLIPLIRLKRSNYTFAIGTILWFDGSFSNDNGWYKCDGGNGTLNLLNKFIRGSPTSNQGDGLGTDTAVNEQHNHTQTTAGNHNHVFSTDPGHPHYYSDTCWGDGDTTTSVGGTTYPKEWIYTSSDGAHDHTGDLYTNGHTHTCNSTGTGDSDNRPTYYSMQLVQRVS